MTQVDTTRDDQKRTKTSRKQVEIDTKKRLEMSRWEDIKENKHSQEFRNLMLTDSKIERFVSILSIEIMTS